MIKLYLCKESHNYEMCTNYAALFNLAENQVVLCFTSKRLLTTEELLNYCLSNNDYDLFETACKVQEIEFIIPNEELNHDAILLNP